MLFEQTFFFTGLTKKKKLSAYVMNIHKQVKKDDSNLISERGCQGGKVQTRKERIKREKIANNVTP